MLDETLTLPIHEQLQFNASQYKQETSITSPTQSHNVLQRRRKTLFSTTGSTEDILPPITSCTLALLRKKYLPSSNHTYTKPIHHHYSPYVTSTVHSPHTRHTPFLQLHPHTHHVVTAGLVGRPC